MNFLVDIGRVLLDFDFEPSLSKLLPHGVDQPRERLRRLLARKDEFEAGKIGVDDYVAWALETLGSNATHEEFHQAWNSIFTPNEPMWECMRHLESEGHQLVLLSNINAIHKPWIYEHHPELNLFHGAVMSFEVGYIKPQPEIYRHAIEVHQLDPQQTLYIDDMAENIEGGRAAGFTSWQYDLNNHGDFEQWLDNALHP